MGLHNIRDDILGEAIFRMDDDVRNNNFLCGIILCVYLRNLRVSSYSLQISQYDNARAKLYALI